MMVEMHAHVVYGVDDGAQSREEMERMLTMAAAGGVTHLICTSHCRPGIKPFPLETYEEHLAEAGAWCSVHAPQLHLYSGAEVLYTPDTLRFLRDGAVPTLAGSRMVLVEFRPDTPEREIRLALNELREAGWLAVLAHVERLRALRSVNRVRALRDTGVLIQMNADTVFDEQAGYFRRRRVERLLRDGMIDFISSDAHDTGRRAFCLEYARLWLTKELGKARADAMCGGAFAARMGWTEE